MIRQALRTRLRPMEYGDIAQVMDIERESFPSMWPQTAYRRELENKVARYVVLSETSLAAQRPQASGLWGAVRRMVGSEPQGSGEFVLGFAGLWLMVGEAHIVTIAVRSNFRRMGIGERLVIACADMAMALDQEVVTLEVRKSNVVAQRLYEKYGFERVGTRTRYYTDNNEDAVIMTTPDLGEASYRRRFEELRAAHRARFPDLWEGGATEDGSAFAPGDGRT
jgi:ribosomal-protein-alanine N-acetyltransferase